jgi:hypothetical protein
LFSLFATGVIDTSGKFAAGVVDTGGNLRCRHRRQICRRCQQHKGNWWQNLAPVSLIPVANLLPVSLILVANLPPVLLIPAANLPPVSLTLVVYLDLRISPRIFEKI